MMNSVCRYLVKTVIILIFVSCDTPSEYVTLPGQRAFEHKLVTLTAKPATAVTDRPITITTSFRPLVTGKGRILFDGGGNTDSAAWKMISPLSSAIAHGTMDEEDIELPIEFAANTDVQYSSQVQLLYPCEYIFTANVILDSVYIADSACYYGESSDVVLQSNGGGGYDRWANLPSYLHLYP